MHPRNAFTLIELLIVIAIIAILSIVVVLTLNPAQLLMQGRDSNRVSDLATLNTALGVYSAQGGTSFGNTNTVYVSIPDPTATSSLGDQCQGLGLISLPATYTYHCAASSTYRLTNGTGWIPVNFSTLPGGSPLGSLPIDPLNTSSTRNYYAYATNGSQYEMTSPMESQKYQLGGSNDVISTDGGTLATVYEKGTAFGLEPLDYGDSSLVGDWSFDEGTGTVAYDYSGSNTTGTWNGTQTGTSGYYSAGKIGNWAGAFDAPSGDVVDAGNPSQLNLSGSFTISVWVNIISDSGLAGIITKSYNAATSMRSYRLGIDSLVPIVEIANNSGIFSDAEGTNPVVLGTWQYLVADYNAPAGTLTIYLNGAPDGTTTGLPTSLNQTTQHFQIGMWDTNTFTNAFNGLIDDARVYNRVLTAAQIAAMYAGGK